MSNNVQQTLGVRNFMNKYLENENIFSELPEFLFIQPVARKVKEKKCTCGLNPEIARTTLAFNDLVENLDISVAQKVASVFGIQEESICFGLQQQDGSFHVKCYKVK